MSKKYIEYEDGKKVELGPDDSPEWTEEMFKKAKFGKEALEDSIGKKNAKKLIEGKVKSRQLGRPISDNPKKQITIRLDSDILEEFKSHGKGWQTEINSVLRDWVENRLQ